MTGRFKAPVRNSLLYRNLLVNQDRQHKTTGAHAVPCYVLRELGWVWWIEFHIEGEIIVGTLRKKNRVSNFKHVNKTK